MTLKIELGKPKADGSRVAYIQLYRNKQKKRINTNIVLYQSEFSKTKKGLNVKNVNKKKLLDELLARYNEICNNAAEILLGSNNNAVVEPHFLGLQPFPLQQPAAQIPNSQMPDLALSSNDYLKYAEEWLETCTNKGKKNYQTALSCFKKFVKTEYLAFGDLTPRLLNDFQNSLYDRPRAQSLYMSSLHHIWTEAENFLDVQLPRDPFKKIKMVRQKPVGQRAITIQIIHKILSYDGPVHRARLARDCFILSFCLIGMNSADLYNCKTLKGGVLAYDRQKVAGRRADHAHTEVKIHPFIEGLVKKYRTANGKYVFDFHSHYSTEVNFNRALNVGLKEILGKNTTVTFYSARHSWATIARNDLGIDKYTINDALVHVDRDMSVTDLYIKKDYRLINEANFKVIDFVFGDMMKKK